MSKCRICKGEREVTAKDVLSGRTIGVDCHCPKPKPVEQPEAVIAEAKATFIDHLRSMRRR